MTYARIMALVGAGLVTFAGGCDEAQRPDAEGLFGPDSAVERVPNATQLTTTQAVIELDVLERVSRRFRAVDDAYRAVGPTYAVTATPQGRTTVSAHDRVAAHAGVVASPPALAVETIALGRGTPQPAPVQGSRVADDGALHLDRGVAVETLANGALGVEQAWIFASPPAGDGDLVLHVRTEGLPYASQTAGGLHFREANAEVGMRYGVATWIDADGRRAHVPISWQGQHIELRVPAAIIDGAAYPAVLDPVVGPEAELDQPVPSVAYGRWTAAASDGVDFLVLWVDYEAGVRSDLYGTRVSSAGNILGESFLIHQDANSPDVVWDGGQYIVVSSKGTASVDSSGNVTHLLLSARGTPAVASNGSATLVVSSTPDIGGAMLDRNGDMMFPPGSLTFCSHPASQFRPDVTWNGTNFIVAWTDFRDQTTLGREIYMTVVTADGTIVTPDGAPIGSSVLDQDYLALSSGGGVTLLAYQENGDIMGLRLDAAGVPIDTAPIPVAQHASLGLGAPQVDFINGRFSVLFSDSADELRGRRIHPSNAISSGAGIVLAGQATGPALAFNGAEVLTLWSDWPGVWELEEVLGQRRNPNFSEIDAAPFVVSWNAENPQTEPRVATNGSDYLVAWSDARYTSPGIYAARVGADGTVQDSPAFFVADGGTATVASDGTDYLLLRSGHGAGIHGTLIGSDGRVGAIDGSVITTQSSASTPAVAWDGGKYLVVWSDRRNYSVSGTDIFGARVRPDGVVRDPEGFTIWNAPGAQDDPALAAGASGFLLAWHHDAGFVVGTKIHGAILAANGTTTATDPLILAAANDSQDSPSIVWDGTGYFMAWEDDRDADDFPAQSSNIYASRITAAGAVVAGSEVAVTQAVGSDLRPSVAFDGADYYVAWTRGEGGARDTVFARLDATGAITKTGPVASAPDADEAHVRIAMSGVEQGLAVYEHKGAGLVRVRARVIRSPIQGDPCTSDGECSTGYCVDGVCCATECAGGSDDCMACSVAAGGAVDGVCGPSDGNLCEDGDLCTLNDRCNAGSCESTYDKTCQAAGPCRAVGTCNPLTGVCSDPPGPDGVPCDDNDVCSQSSSCQGGACQGSDPVECPDPGQCKVGVCIGYTYPWGCTSANEPYGTPCDDGDANTLNDICISGQCIGEEPSCEDILATCESDRDQCVADYASCDGDLTTCEGVRDQCVADYASCDGDLTTCEGVRDQCAADHASCDGDLTTCEGVRDQCAADYASCDGDLTTCEGVRDQCVIDRDDAQTQLALCDDGYNACSADLISCEGERDQCAIDYGSCDGELTTCEGVRDQCVIDRDDAQTQLGICDDAFTQCDGERSTCEGVRDQCIIDRDDAQAQLGQCSSALASCQGQHDQCLIERDNAQAQLATCDAAFAGCSADLVSCEGERDQCITDRDDARTQLATCDGELTQCAFERDELADRFATCEGALLLALADVAACEGDLASCLADNGDGDGDGERDARDACPGTEAGAAIDDAGCSLSQFCARVVVLTSADSKLCAALDWRNDEPTASRPADCRVLRDRSTRESRCVPDI